MIIRTYRCDDCQQVFEVTLDSGNDGDPDCPSCTKVLDWVPTRFATTTVKTKAVKVAQDILEQDYGLTNWKDGNREGDVAAIMPAPTRQQTEEQAKIAREVQQMAEQARLPPASMKDAPQGVWGNSGRPANPMMMSTLLASAKASMSDPRPGMAQPDPVAMALAGARQSPVKLDIVARWKPGQN